MFITSPVSFIFSFFSWLGDGRRPHGFRCFIRFFVGLLARVVGLTASLLWFISASGSILVFPSHRVVGVQLLLIRGWEVLMHLCLLAPGGLQLNCLDWLLLVKNRQRSAWCENLFFSSFPFYTFVQTVLFKCLCFFPFLCSAHFSSCCPPAWAKQTFSDLICI